MPTYTFDEAQARAAHDEWGFNCGPAALAFALQTTIDAVRHAIPHFAERRYTSPTMMAEALEFLGRRFMRLAAAGSTRSGKNNVRACEVMFRGPMHLVRIQWTGPWIVGGKPQRWAARQTHWIATWAERGVALTFDINGGIRGFGGWESETVPAIVATVPRADGGWYPANIWRLTPVKE